MTRICAALAMTCATALAGPALAEGWVVTDLGEVESRDLCMDRADRVLNAYLEANGGHSVESDSWTKYGYDLEPGDNDVLIMCPVVNGGVYNAFLVVYGAFVETTDDHTDQVTAELQHLWDAETEPAPQGSRSVAGAMADLDRALNALTEAQAAVTAAQEALRAAAAGEEEGEEVIDLDAPTGEEEEWIDLDELLGPLKQELREGVAPAASEEDEPAEEVAPALEEEAAPVEEAPDLEDISPVDPR